MRTLRLVAFLAVYLILTVCSIFKKVKNPPNTAGQPGITVYENITFYKEYPA